MVKIGINGLGRIGRLALRSILKNPQGAEVVALNNIDVTPEYMTYLMRYDTAHRPWRDIPLAPKGKNLLLKGVEVPFHAEKDPANVDWSGCDVVLECTGKFLTQEKAANYLKGGAKRVIMSAPAKDETPTYVFGVNHTLYKSDQKVISNASCTTNCLAPVAHVLHKKLGIAEGLMTTVHAMTITQSVVDGPSSKDWRSGRTASANIIPASTGAAKAVAKVIPELKGKLTGMSFRVPTIDVSVVDLTFKTVKESSYEEICKLMKEASEGDLKGILGYTDEAVVSSDFLTDPHSAIFDAKAGIGLNKNFFKVVAWYDNEWGYAVRLVDLARYVTAQR